MKEQKRMPGKELHKIELSNLSDAEFKTLVIRMLKELSEDLEQHKKDPIRNKGYANETTNSLQGNNRRVDEAKNQINDVEDKEAKNN